MNIFYKINNLSFKAQKYVFFLFIIVFSIGIVEALVLSPADYKQSDSVRIMYVHVPSAWTSVGIFSVIAILSLGNLIFKNKYFLTILIFIMSLFILTILLTISGIGFESSFKLSILTLMNTVNSSIYGLNDFDFNNLNFFIKYCLIIFMIIGRIELLTILLLFKKFLFKN